MPASDVLGIASLLLAVGGAIYLLLARPGAHVPKKAERDDERSADTMPPTVRGEARHVSTPPPRSSRAASGVEALVADIPRLASLVEDDEEVLPTRVGPLEGPIQPPVEKIVLDEGAEVDGGPGGSLGLVVHALAETHPGKRRKQNQDSLLVDEARGLFVVADGMGGHRGGELASKLAVGTMADAFESDTFDAAPHADLPALASELARAIQMANRAILSTAVTHPELEGMGTTVCAARFSADKQRLYVGHVGDSRCYRVRDGVMRQMTRDHTMADYGVGGPQGAHLSRAVGIWPTVPIDVVMARPELGDVYLLCSDGLTKMLADEAISTELLRDEDPKLVVDKLIDLANAQGGKDNITVIIMRVVESTPG